MQTRIEPSEIDIVIAEHLGHKCLTCDGKGSYLLSDSLGLNPVSHTCTDCHGAGSIFPMRAPCPVIGAWGRRRKRLAVAPEDLHAVMMERMNCVGCHGRGWVPAEMHFEDLKVEARNCGIFIHESQDGKGWFTETVRHTRSGDYAYEPSEAQSILTAAKMAVLASLL